MSTLEEVRARVRRDLHDEDSNSYRWSDDALDRHIARALAEVSQVAPHEKTAAMQTTAGRRELSLESLADRVIIEAVEYPAGDYPPTRVLFSVWGDTLKLHVTPPPDDSKSVTVYYGALHRLDDASSTLPEGLEEILITGAAAYAAMEWANYAVNRLNVGGQDVWRQYLTWAEERLAAFESQLARTGRRSGVRARSLFLAGDQASQGPSGQIPIRG